LGAGGAGFAGIGIPFGAVGPCDIKGGVIGGPEAKGGRRGGADRAGGGAASGAFAAVSGATSAGGAETFCTGASGSAVARVAASIGLGASAAGAASGGATAGTLPLTPKCRRTAKAASSSSELEWVFFSWKPSSGSNSRITPGLTSSSRANSLMRILLIPSGPQRCFAEAQNCLRSFLKRLAHASSNQDVSVSILTDCS
jgi:hypothetical protein